MCFYGLTVFVKFMCFYEICKDSSSLSKLDAGWLIYLSLIIDNSKFTLIIIVWEKKLHHFGSFSLFMILE